MHSQNGEQWWGSSPQPGTSGARPVPSPSISCSSYSIICSLISCKLKTPWKATLALPAAAGEDLEVGGAQKFLFFPGPLLLKVFSYILVIQSSYSLINVISDWQIKAIELASEFPVVGAHIPIKYPLTFPHNWQLLVFCQSVKASRSLPPYAWQSHVTESLVHF